MLILYILHFQNRHSWPPLLLMASLLLMTSLLLVMVTLLLLTFMLLLSSMLLCLSNVHAAAGIHAVTCVSAVVGPTVAGVLASWCCRNVWLLLFLPRSCQKSFPVPEGDLYIPHGTKVFRSLDSDFLRSPMPENSGPRSETSAQIYRPSSRKQAQNWVYKFGHRPDEHVTVGAKYCISLIFFHKVLISGIEMWDAKPKLMKAKSILWFPEVWRVFRLVIPLPRISHLWEPTRAYTINYTKKYRCSL